MYDQQITYLSSNQRRTHMVRFFLFRSKKLKQQKRRRPYRLPFFDVTIVT